MPDIVDTKTILEAFPTEHDFGDIGIKDGLERLLLSRVTQREVKVWIRNHAAPYIELMAYYRRVPRNDAALFAIYKACPTIYIA